MGIFSEIFSWWGGNTWSNRIYTLLRGKLVGTDDAGNRYYVQSKGVGPLGVPRRWVIYRNLARRPRRCRRSGTAGCTTLVDTPPTDENYAPRPWQKPHRMNMTGTPQAYRPSGSILATGKRPHGDRRLQALAAALSEAARRHAGATCLARTRSAATTARKRISQCGMARRG